MGTYRLARHLPSPSLLTDSWAGLSDAGRPVLVLRRKEPWAQAPGFLERFAPWQRGWQALRQAEGVLPLVEVGQADGGPCVVQDFVESESLRLALMGPSPPGKTAFSVVESVAVVLQAVRGLLWLAQLSPSLAHGDISATNLLLGSDGVVRLEAIGVAAATPADPVLGPARAELLCLAPEEVEGRVAPSTDIFRLGLVWLELLTGKPAFGGTSYAEVKARFEKFPGVTPGHFPSLPQPIPMVLAMMLAKTPTARPSVSDLELMLSQAWAAIGANESFTRPLAEAFGRLFAGRVPVGSQLQGGSLITVTAPGSTGLADGAVKLARINTRRVSAEDVAASRAQDATDAAKVAARDWTLKHARDEENPKDFSLGATLIEMQRLTVEQVDAALQHAQSLSATMFDSLCALDTIDEDEMLPIAAGLLKQQYLTGPQLLELNLGKAQAAMLARDTADDWQVIPLKLEAGGLTVALSDPNRADVLDEVKLRARARSVTAVRATERTIQEGIARIYDGKTSPPEWATKRAPPPAPMAAAPPGPSFELDVQEPMPPPASQFPAVGSWPAMPPPMTDPAFQMQAPLAPAPFPFPAAGSPAAVPAPFPFDPSGFAPAPFNPAGFAPPAAPYKPAGFAQQAPAPAAPAPYNAAGFAPQAPYAQHAAAPAPYHPAGFSQHAPPAPAAPFPFDPSAFSAPAAPAPFPFDPTGFSPHAPPPAAPAPFPFDPAGFTPNAPPPAAPAPFPFDPPGFTPQAPPLAAAPFPFAPPGASPPPQGASPPVRSAPPAPPVPAPAPPAPLPPVPPPSAPPAIAPVVAPPPSAPQLSAELHRGLDVATRLLDALLSTMGERGLEASAMISLVRSVAKQAGAMGAPLDQVRLSVAAVVIAALLEGKRAFEVPSRPAAAACLGPHWRDFEDFVRPLLDGDEALPSDPRGVVLSLCFEVANTVGSVPKNLAEASATLDALRSRYPLAALAALEIVLAGH